MIVNRHVNSVKTTIWYNSCRDMRTEHAMSCMWSGPMYMYSTCTLCILCVHVWSVMHSTGPQSFCHFVVSMEIPWEPVSVHNMCCVEGGAMFQEPMPGPIPKASQMTLSNLAMIQCWSCFHESQCGTNPKFVPHVRSDLHQSPMQTVWWPILGA